MAFLLKMVKKEEKKNKDKKKYIHRDRLPDGIKLTGKIEGGRLVLVPFYPGF